MKTIVTTSFILLLGWLQMTAFSQEITQNTDSLPMQPIPLEIPDDPRFTQADIDRFFDAANGAPVKAELMQDQRALPLEIPAEGVNFLAPPDASPVDEEAEYQRWLKSQEIVKNPAEVQSGIPANAAPSQPIPEPAGSPRDYRTTAGSPDQPPGEKPAVVNPGYPKESGEQPKGEAMPK